MPHEGTVSPVGISSDHMARLPPDQARGCTLSSGQRPWGGPRTKAVPLPPVDRWPEAQGVSSRCEREGWSALPPAWASAHWPWGLWCGDPRPHGSALDPPGEGGGRPGSAMARLRQVPARAGRLLVLKTFRCSFHIRVFVALPWLRKSLLLQSFIKAQSSPCVLKTLFSHTFVSSVWKERGESLWEGD